MREEAVYLLCECTHYLQFYGSEPSNELSTVCIKRKKKKTTS